MIELELQLAGNLRIERVDLGVERGHAVAVAHGGERGGDLRRRRAGLIADAHDERGTAAIDHGIGELRGDDFAPQPMLLDRIREFLGDGGRKIAT
jgi:hypothetical protein